jgi:LexA-binding, inner membrane-associated putative hydrolase
MPPFTHALAGWCVGNAVETTPRERLGCIVIACLPDIDGISLIWGRDVYFRWHHVLGHNVIFGIVASALLMRLTCSGLKIGTLYLFTFHVHLLMDLFGSGPRWGIAYLWPISIRHFSTAWAWAYTGWQNFAVLFGLSLITLWIGVRLRRTPLEVVAPRLDALLVGRSAREV